jgi:peptidyl-prolyl cis-trans isomerase SurA
MNKLVASFCLTLAVFAALPVHAQLLATEPLDRIVAVAEDDVILQSELDRAIANIVQQYRSNPQQLPPRDVLGRQVLDRLIMMRLQVQRAQSTGIRVTDTDVDQAIQRISQDNHIDSGQLRASLAQQGMDYDEFRKGLREELLVQRLRQRVAQGSGQVTDAEIDTVLASGNVKTGEVHLAHILIGVPDGANAQQIQQAKDKADDVKKQIDGGMDFTAAAIRYSNASDALDGGDLKWRRMDSVPPAFAELAESLQAGQVSQIIRAPNGFHIIKMIDKRSNAKQVVTEYHARHIEVAVTELVASDEAQKRIADLRHRIVENHEDFAKLAKEFSKDPQTANLGGEMGWFPIDQYGPKVAEVVAALKESNEVSPPFQTDLGWHIVQLLGKRDSDRTEQTKRDQARDVLRQRKAEDEYENFLRTIRSDAYICAVNSTYAGRDLQACGAASEKKADAP